MQERWENAYSYWRNRLKARQAEQEPTLFDDDSGCEAVTGEYEVKDGELLYAASLINGPLMGVVLLKEEEGVDIRDVKYMEVRRKPSNIR